MAIQLSHRGRAIKPSPTLTVSALAKAMMQQGEDIINFGVGEPDFPTPQKIKDEAINAINNDFTRYTASSGILELREAISAKLKRDNNLICNPDDILVSPGAKASIINILMAICDPRDEILLPTPYWVSYVSQIELVDAHPILVRTEMSNDFKVTATQLEEKIKTMNTPKALILNSPNNPTGMVYTKKELEDIAEVCLKNEILIISDEIYEKLIYDDEQHFSIASISPEIRNNTILINGVSKAYAMTGWRLGYAAGPTDVIKLASRIQSHTTSCVNSITQRASITALNECEEDIAQMRMQFEKRRNYLINALNTIPNVQCLMPKGAFYAMPEISFYIKNNTKNIQNTEDLCEYLLKEFKIAIVPGTAFGADNNVRYSKAKRKKKIKKNEKQ